MYCNKLPWGFSLRCVFYDCALVEMFTSKGIYDKGVLCKI